ncbi:hypothetical protein [Streptomyces sp. NPDC001889]
MTAFTPVPTTAPTTVRNTGVCPLDGGTRPQTAHELYALRSRINRAALTNRPGSPLPVVLYVLAAPHGRRYGGPGGDEAFAEAQGYADRHRLPVHRRVLDTTGDTDPRSRPGWARALQAVADGRAHGIVAASRAHVTAITGWYTDVLHWCTDQRAVLYLVRSETSW